jgi:hypothetical protein
MALTFSPTLSSAPQHYGSRHVPPRQSVLTPSNKPKPAPPITLPTVEITRGKLAQFVRNNAKTLSAAGLPIEVMEKPSIGCWRTVILPIEQIKPLFASSANELPYNAAKAVPRPIIAKIVRAVMPYFRSPEHGGLTSQTLVQAMAKGAHLNPPAPKFNRLNQSV